MSSVSLPAVPPSQASSGSTTIRLDAALILQIGRRNGPSFVLDPHRGNTLGRSTDAGIVVPDRLASRGHAVIERDPQDGRWQVRDLGSRNGTWVDGLRVDEATLEPGMTLRIGTTELVFRTFSRRLNDTETEAAGVMPSYCRFAGKTPALKMLNGVWKSVPSSCSVGGASMVCMKSAW